MRSYPRIKIVPSKSQAVLNLSSIINFFTPTIFLKVSRPTSNAFDLYWKKKQRGGRLQIDPT